MGKYNDNDLVRIAHKLELRGNKNGGSPAAGWFALYSLVLASTDDQGVEIIDHDSDGETQAEIAAAMSVSRRTVARRLHDFHEATSARFRNHLYRHSANQTVSRSTSSDNESSYD